MILGATGHRLHILPRYTGEVSSVLRAKLLETAVEVMEEWHPDLLITGMATGWDQAMACAAMVLNIPFHAYVPFEGQQRLWGKFDRDNYALLLDEATEVRVISPCQSSYAYIQRDQAMVDASDHMAALLLPGQENSGTARTIEYAEGWLVPWTNYADNLLEKLQMETAPRR